MISTTSATVTGTGYVEITVYRNGNAYTVIGYPPYRGPDPIEEALRSIKVRRPFFPEATRVFSPPLPPGPAPRVTRR